MAETIAVLVGMLWVSTLAQVYALGVRGRVLVHLALRPDTWVTGLELRQLYGPQVYGALADLQSRGVVRSNPLDVTAKFKRYEYRLARVPLCAWNGCKRIALWRCACNVPFDDNVFCQEHRDETVRSGDQPADHFTRMPVGEVARG